MLVSARCRKRPGHSQSRLQERRALLGPASLTRVLRGGLSCSGWASSRRLIRFPSALLSFRAERRRREVEEPALCHSERSAKRAVEESAFLVSLRPLGSSASSV